MLLSASHIHQELAMKTMPMFTSIDHTALDGVTGGAARVAATAKSSDLDSQLQLMLTQISDAIEDVAKPNTNDQLMPMMMMMMMGGGGGSSAPAAAPAPSPASVIRVNVR
jgi:hypothetical protein